MLKRSLVRLMYAGCWAIDHTPSFLLTERLRSHGCPSGLAFRAARLEDRWGLTRSPADKGRPRGHNPGAGQ